jgi:hypothetical protein
MVKSSLDTTALGSSPPSLWLCCWMVAVTFVGVVVVVVVVGSRGGNGGSCATCSTSAKRGQPHVVRYSSNKRKSSLAHNAGHSFLVCRHHSWPSWRRPFLLAYHHYPCHHLFRRRCPAVAASSPRGSALPWARAAAAVAAVASRRWGPAS